MTTIDAPVGRSISEDAPPEYDHLRQFHLTSDRYDHTPFLTCLNCDQTVCVLEDEDTLAALVAVVAGHTCTPSGSVHR